MHMKSYFAESVQLAVEQARRELGPDAALVTSRVTTAEAHHLGRYEVVFAYDLPASPAPAPPVAPSASASGGAQGLAAEVGVVRREVDTWRRTMFEWMDQPRWMVGEPELERAYFHMLDAEVDRDLAVHLLASARKTAGGEGSDCRDAIAAEIRRCARVDPVLGVESVSQKLVALVGPPGAGKTAAIAKLAIRYGISERRPIALIAYDGERLAASEELRWYASVLGVAFHAVDTNLALSQAIEQHCGKHLVLIDTPGFTARDLANGNEQAEYLARREDIQTHLTLPVSMRSGDLARVSGAFDVFNPSRLIFTRLDETEVYGPILSESARSGRPISFFSAGQRVPEDLQPASGEFLVERLLPTASECGRKALSAA